MGGLNSSQIFNVRMTSITIIQRFGSIHILSFSFHLIFVVPKLSPRLRP